ncbi:MAG TPA: hypothetical protein VFY73_02010 [Ideonella sp.]|uniref:hypothetical protein n=1 Tax=Ideonella sp. TaxID=1929293 RepID=UPI002E31F6FF|nr:hypothetical protein [Ideonella sp.]HEX5682783.1 hypothetical protein [Ideonella sp.]
MTTNSHRTLITSLLSTLPFILANSAQAHAQAQEAHSHGPVAVSASKLVQTDATLRDLWLGHAFWTRAVSAELLSGNEPAAAAAEEQAVANARQLSQAMAAFYGSAASEQVFKLLAGHYGAVKQYTLATRAHSAQTQDAARQAMVKNAEEIAVFLSSANPNLPIDGLRGMLLAHGGHHMQQIQQLADRQYTQEAQTWGAMKDHMYGIADALTLAIAKQFPKRFD